MMFQRIQNFNTSHVNVNRLYIVNHPPEDQISIHLMLMLILDMAEDVTGLTGFQYISC